MKIRFDTARRRLAGAHQGERIYAGEDRTPRPLRLLGRPEILELPLTAIFSSRGLPADLLLPALDLARQLRDSGVAVIGGFHSAVERAMLRLLLRGNQPVAVCPARTLEGYRLPREWNRPVDAGQLVIASDLPERWRRPCAKSAALRDRLVIDVASRLFVMHAQPGSRTFHLAAEAIDRGMAVECFDHPSNRDLVLLGATVAVVLADRAGSNRKPEG